MCQIRLVAAGDTSYRQASPFNKTIVCNGLASVFRTARMKVAFDAETFLTSTASLVALDQMQG